MKPDRAARAAALRGFFALSLDFAGMMAQRSGLSLGDSVLRNTCLHRRFGMGYPAPGGGPGWGSFIAGLEAQPDAMARLDWAEAFYLSAPEEPAPAGRSYFGCFGYLPPDAAGVARLHFLDRDDDGSSPLHDSKLAQRQSDLAALVADLRQAHPSAKRIAGMSWLYHQQSYRRIFPVNYLASVRPPKRVRMNGLSSWGQMLSHGGTLRSAMADAFRANWPLLDPAVPWLALPLPPLAASAPLAAFNARNVVGVAEDPRFGDDGTALPR